MTQLLCHLCLPPASEGRFAPSLPAQRSVGALFDSFRIGAGREFDDAAGVCLRVEEGPAGGALLALPPAGHVEKVAVARTAPVVVTRRAPVSGPLVAGSGLPQYP